MKGEQEEEWDAEANHAPESESPLTKGSRRLRQALGQRIRERNMRKEEEEEKHENPPDETGGDEEDFVVGNKSVKGSLVDQRKERKEVESGLVFSELMELHKCPSGHPERPERHRFIVRKLTEERLDRECTAIAARECTPEELARVHSDDHVQWVEGAYDEHRDLAEPNEDGDDIVQMQSGKQQACALFPPISPLTFTCSFPPRRRHIPVRKDSSGRAAFRWVRVRGDGQSCPRGAGHGHGGSATPWPPRPLLARHGVLLLLQRVCGSPKSHRGGRARARAHLRFRRAPPAPSVGSEQRILTPLLFPVLAGAPWRVEALASCSLTRCPIQGQPR